MRIMNGQLKLVHNQWVDVEYSWGPDGGLIASYGEDRKCYFGPEVAMALFKAGPEMTRKRNDYTYLEGPTGTRAGRRAGRDPYAQVINSIVIKGIARVRVMRSSPEGVYAIAVPVTELNKLSASYVDGTEAAADQAAKAHAVLLRAAQRKLENAQVALVNAEIGVERAQAELAKLEPEAE